jgi:2-keto-4-pentenoate hydratase/2-oxohepta-3-ene-1,7-dioic acid hydratase in catechol pathway
MLLPTHLTTGIMIFLLLIPLSSHSDNLTFVHFEHNNSPRYGLLSQEKVYLLKGTPFSNYSKTNTIINLENTKLLPATSPSKILAVGLNYRSHLGSQRGSNPRLFSKVTSSLTATDTPVWLFPDSNNLHYEGELVIVIGKQAQNIKPEQAAEYILGVTAGNDITDRNWQSSDLQWLRGKGADSFSPIAPYIVTGLNYNNLLVETRVNGKTVQSERSSNLLFSVDEIVSYASQYFTLYPGDLIFTGTPGTTRALKAGDVVEVEVEGVGVVSNTVTKRIAD